MKEMLAEKSRLTDCYGVVEMKMYKYSKRSVPYQCAAGSAAC